MGIENSAGDGADDQGHGMKSEGLEGCDLAAVLPQLREDAIAQATPNKIVLALGDKGLKVENEVGVNQALQLHKRGRRKADPLPAQLHGQGISPGRQINDQLVSVELKGLVLFGHG